MNITVEDYRTHLEEKHNKSFWDRKNKYWNNKLKDEAKTCIICEYLYDNNFWNYYWGQK